MQRLKAKLGFGPKKPETILLSVPDGDIEVSKQEEEIFSLLFRIVDSDGDTLVGGAEGALFLSRSGLSREQLREVWRMACGGVSKPRLNLDNWFIACKIVGLAQQTGACELGPLLAKKKVPLPDFQFYVRPMVDHSPLDPVLPKSISVRVGSPTQVGSAMTKHMVYEVVTSTSLPQFPRGEVAVNRRYSDFLWLHRRLCTAFPGCLIPRFPEKKLVGNMNAEFVDERRSALQVYMQKVVHHSRLVTSVDLLVFLDSSAEGLAAAQTLVGKLDSIFNGGFDPMKLVGSLTGSSRGMLVKADEDFVDNCAKSSAALARLTSVVTVSDNVLATRKGVAYEMSRIGSYLSTLSTHERVGATAGAGATAAAAARQKEAQAQIAAMSAGGGAGTSLSAHRTEAELAFAAHQDAEASKTGGIDDMFNVDFGDPFATTLSAAVPERAEAATIKTVEEREAERRAKQGVIPVVETMSELSRRFGAELEAMSNRTQDQLDKLNEVFFDPVRSEQERAAEIEEAATRRQLAVDQLHATHALLARRKKTYASVRASKDGGAGGKAEAAEAAVTQAETQLEDMKQAVDGITRGLKLDMARAMQRRRVTLITRLVDLVEAETRFARSRAAAWNDVLPFLSQDTAELGASYTKVSDVEDVPLPAKKA